MPGINEIKNSVPYYGKQSLKVEDHNTDDIINCLQKYHPKHGPAYDKISQHYWKGNVKDTAIGLFEFLKHNVRYDTEPDHYQTVKSPGAILHDGHGDCKHYASFITGVVDSLARKGYKIKSKYRFVSDTPKSEIHHVFAVVSDGIHDYWVDPVLRTFDKRPTFYNIKDSEMNNTIGQLYHISGTNEMEQVYNTPAKVVATLKHYNLLPGHFSSPGHLYNFLHHHHRHPGQHNPHHPQTTTVTHRDSIRVGESIGKTKHKNFLKQIAHGIQVNTKNVAHGMQVNAANAKAVVLKIGVAPARNAFLSLVGVNAFNLAHKLHDTLLSNNKQPLLREWQNLGGNTQKLINTVNFGYKQYKTKHGGYNVTRDNISGIGIEPASLASLTALASGIIAALSKFFAHTPADQKEISLQHQKGAKELIEATVSQAAAGADDITHTSPDGQKLAANTSVAPDGTPEINISHKEQTKPNADNSELDDYSSNKSVLKVDQSGKITADPGGALQDMATGLKNFVFNNKLILGLGVAGVIGYKILTGKRKKR